MEDKNQILALLYDDSIEDLQYTQITLTLSTLIHDRLAVACRKTNLSVDSFLNVAIIRALFDYEQYSNTLKD